MNANTQIEIAAPETIEARKRRRQRGVTSVEYAVMLVLVAIAVLGIGNSFSGAVKNVFTSLSTNLK